MGYNALDRSVAGKLTAIAASGATARGPSAFCSDDLWQRAVDLIYGSRSSAIVSGFFVPRVSSPETDGPLGSMVLARALAGIGKDVRVWTDGLCLNAFRRCAEVIGFPVANVEDASVDGFDPGGVDLLIYIERLGRARDGNYYNMRGEDIRSWTAPLDSFALYNGAARTIGIGDGGNEVGMGCLEGELCGMMPDYADCLCVIGADVCIPVDVSNWGAYALAAAVSAVEGKWLGQSTEEESAMLYVLAESGAVDGLTGKREPSVDGLRLERHLEIVSLLREAVGL